MRALATDDSAPVPGVRVEVHFYSLHDLAVPVHDAPHTHFRVRELHHVEVENVLVTEYARHTRLFCTDYEVELHLEIVKQLVF